MTPQLLHEITRRRFLGSAGGALGTAALATLFGGGSSSAETTGLSAGADASLPHFPPRAKRVIFLHQSGAPSQIDLFDPKPQLKTMHGKQIPESIRMGQRLTSMTADQDSKPLTASLFDFQRYGECGHPVSELLPATAKVVDDLCFVHSLHTEAINHDPAITFIHTGSQQPGRPSMGSWTSYGLGTESADLPAFVVFISGGVPGDQPLFGRLWGSGFLPSEYQGAKFRAGANPVLHLANPPGVDAPLRRTMLNSLKQLNGWRQEAVGDPEIAARIAQYEMAYRMQMSLPELTDLSDESEQTFEMYGPDCRRAGTYAANCLMARRLVERGVRFVQLYHRGWDHHTNLPTRIRAKCEETDQPSAALIMDLKQRGLLDDTLVVWTGEFGRTAYCQGKLTEKDYGRDHHPRCFTAWLAGGGIKRGYSFGKTDAFSYNITENPVHVHDLQATILHCLGIDHTRLTFRFQGRDFRLTDIAGRVVTDILT